MNSNDIRKKYLDFFAKQGHTIVPSSSLVPYNDATLLFTNAGMVQFKDVFLGLDHRAYQRAVSAQRCVRAGGKHNDLENVGYTARHHTFFEMLGNFSFGDYFKREAIHYAWDFLTKELQLPKEKLWITVYDQDPEAADIWLNDIGIDPNRLSRIGAKDNFWSMGETGPCGPCSEIFYDHGPEIWGGPPGSAEEDGDRYVEIWNLVFMQYNRSADGTLTPLPKPSVDTGMGLERIVAVMQGVHNNYDTDLFQPIIKKIAALAKQTDLTNQSLRVIADHLRAAAFLIVDGVRPLNEGRGYVLRRIMRRAIRHGHKLGLSGAFFYTLLPALIDVMGDAYPELITHCQEIADVMRLEEEQFEKTLAQGMKLLEQAITHAAQTNNIIAGAVIFKLYDTYGFPVDLTADIAREHQVQLDEAGFDAAMAQQRTMSKAASKFGAATKGQLNLTESTEFNGYERLQHSARILAIYQDQNPVHSLSAGNAAAIVLDQTPFYAESGGQAGDQGCLIFNHGRFMIDDTQKVGNGVLHIGTLASGELTVGANVLAQVNQDSRYATAANHSATHLLHAALKIVLGPHVEQKGSLVSKERLRFDFTQPAALTSEQIQQIEHMVNERIRLNHPIVTELMTPEHAAKSGATALFGEKYGATVRVLSMGDFSKELCGGTHATHTGDIGLFKIIEETNIAAGIRRIEAATGKMALAHVQQDEQLLRSALHLLKANRHNLIDKLMVTAATQKQLEKKLAHLEAQVAEQIAQQLLTEVDPETDWLISEVPNMSPEQLRQIAEQLKPSLTVGGGVLASVFEGRVYLVAVVSAKAAEHIKASVLIQKVAVIVEGKGGGRADFAQASGPATDKISEALAAAKAVIPRDDSFCATTVIF